MSFLSTDPTLRTTALTHGDCLPSHRRMWHIQAEARLKLNFLITTTEYIHSGNVDRVVFLLQPFLFFLHIYLVQFLQAGSYIVLRQFFVSLMSVPLSIKIVMSPVQTALTLEISKGKCLLLCFYR